MALVAASIFLTGLTSIGRADNTGVDGAGPADDSISIQRIQPEGIDGHGYRLSYRVNAPFGIFWKFKTDFSSTVLTENKFILAHRFVAKDKDVVITENKYSYGPDVFFKWQTTIVAPEHRLDFILLNPTQCQQAYHYGTIQLEPDGQGTRVTQIAYFDFFGAAFWSIYPWEGGMKDFLTYTAKWEQAIALRLRDEYDVENIPGE
ncbi:MAG: hypothetical protein WBY88_17065 [Desulfosarcina sp.]